MGSSNSKVQCLLRPGQSGKTRTIQDLIREYAELANVFHGEGATPLDIVICSNNRSLVDQTMVRMNRDLFDGDAGSDISDEGQADTQVTGNCLSWVSGTSNVVTPSALAFDILVGKVSMVVCCAHKKRLDYVYQLLINLSKVPSYKSKVNIWIDEADASIKLWSREEIDVTRMPIVQTVTLVSATFNKVLEEYKRLRVLGYTTTHPACYHKVADCVKVIDNSPGDAVAYMSAVLASHPEIVTPGARVFMPGDRTQASHDDIATLLTEKGFAVLVLNGMEKAIRLPYGLQPLLMGDNHSVEPEEIGRQMARMYREFNLSQYPFAVTGHLCIGRGLTFQNEEFVFDFGVIPDIGDPAMAYQTACRLAGNIREYPGYKPATLIASAKTWDVVVCQEAFAVNLARIVKERGLSDVGQEEFDEAAGIVRRLPVCNYALSPTFATSAEVTAWCDRNLTYGRAVYGLYDAEGNAGTTHIKYRAVLRPLLTESELRSSLDMGQGANSYARVMPVVDAQWGIADAARVMPVNGEAAIVWIAIYKKDKRRVDSSVRAFFGPRLV